MVLKDFPQLWGVDIVYISRYSKQYRVKAAIFYLVDLIFISILIFFMWLSKTAFGAYLVIMLIFTFLFMGFFSVMLDVNAWQSYKFYRKYKNYKVETFYSYVDEDVLQSLLFCVKSHKKVKEKSVGAYIDALLALCAEDSTRAMKLYHLLQKYKEGTGVRVKVSYISTGKITFRKEEKSYITDIEVVADETKKENEEELNEEVLLDDVITANNDISNGTNEGAGSTDGE